MPWLRLVEHLDDINDGARLGGWLATTARREALTLLRRAGRSVLVEDVDVMEGIADHTVPPFDERLIVDEEHQALWRAFGLLSVACQRLLRMVFADPPPRYEDISAALDMPVGSIGPTRARCLANLRSFLPAPAAD